MRQLHTKINYVVITGIFLVAFLLHGGIALAATNYTLTAGISAANTCQTMAMSSDGKYMDCALSNGPLMFSTDYGANWSFASGSGIDTRQGAAVSSTGQYILGTSDFGITNVSNDYGATWTNTSHLAQDTMDAMSASGQYMMMTSDSGAALLSTDFGVTWNAVGGGLPSGVTHAIAMSASGQKIIVGTTSGAGNLYISNDYGSTWTPASAPGSNAPSSISMSSNGTEIYLADKETSVYFSGNEGGSWTTQTIGGASQLNQVAASANGQRALVSDSLFNSFYTTLDSGQNWVALPGAIVGQGGLAVSSDMSYIVFATPARVVVGFDGTLVIPINTPPPPSNSSPSVPDTGYGTPATVISNTIIYYFVAGSALLFLLGSVLRGSKYNK